MFKKLPVVVGRHSGRAAFTLVEIMIIVALIGLIAALAFPSYIKSRKQSQGRRVVSDARMLDSAVHTWALENGKKDGDAIDTWSPDGIISYLKSTWSTTGPLQFNDVLGYPYDFGVVGLEQVRINSTTRTALEGVGIDWGSY
jgi:type II secretory pathway pseudopilin PulG